MAMGMGNNFGFLVGFSKTGISGFMMPVIPIIASVFGGKESTGVILPLLLIGDVFALYYYNRHANWRDNKKTFALDLHRTHLRCYSWKLH
ncbi:hypothetical protein [Clostridium sp. CF012]|uniref:hypothetical protein n=1 Tax=Clostridium sp. CF012 TaxID=2843319 RepID=UPI00209B5446|nr:hypothetical protein [Clostridium sp. CF012]